MKSFRSFLAAAIGYFFSPVVIIALFGPLIQYVNIVILRHRLSFQSEESMSGLLEALDGLWVSALISFNNQMFVLLLAWVFIFIEFVRVVQPQIRDYSFNRLRKLANQSTSTYLMLLIVVLFFFGGMFTFLAGAFASPKLISLYKPASLETAGVLTLPPFNSNITIARGLIIFQSLFFSYWEKSVLPNLISKDNNTHNEIDQVLD